MLENAETQKFFVMLDKTGYHLRKAKLVLLVIFPKFDKLKFVYVMFGSQWPNRYKVIGFSEKN